MYQVQKKDGTLVDFDQNKIIVGIIKAGGTPENAQTVAANVETWLPTVVVNNVVNVSDLKTKVIAELRITNPPVAASFESYKKA
jgi:transcriptional regulator NrdR family protein